jgi:hypothetical protein
LKRAASALLIGLAVTACGIERAPDQTNKVVVILDRSGTYAHRLDAAMSRVMTLLETMGKTKLKRWDRAADTIALISLDAMPEVVWQGSLRDLHALKQDAWTSRLQSRSDYAQCTDVEAAFRLAAQHLTGDPQIVHKYLFVFSDLVAEPPTGSLRTCQAPAIPSVPSKTFPWEALGDVQTKVFWVPPDQKLAWSRAAAEQGLQDQFVLYTTSEAATVTLDPPARPKVKRTEAERQESQQRMKDVAWTWVGRIGAAVALLVGLFVGGQWWLSRGMGQTPRPASARRRGPVPPLPASALRRPGGPNPSRGPQPPQSTPSASRAGERSTPNGHHGL